MTGLALVPVAPADSAVGPARREHADREDYRSWLRRHHDSPAVRSNRLRAYEVFVERWPHLPAWFAAPLIDRIDLPRPHLGPGQVGGASHDAMPYLTYLSLVHGVALDYELLLVRPLTSPFTTLVHPGGLGVDHDLFSAHQQRLELTRRHAEDFLRWFATQTSQQTGRPLATTTRRSVITLLGSFASDTAAWGWTTFPAGSCSPTATSRRSPSPCRATSPRPNSTP